MKFSAMPRLMPGISLEEVCDEAAKRGFEGIELYDSPEGLSLLRYGLNKAAAKKFRDMVASKRLVLPDIAHGAVGTTENDLALLKIAMDLAVTLDVKLIRTSIGGPPAGVQPLQFMFSQIENLKKAVKMAEDCDITLGLDNFYFITVIDNVNIARRINSPHLKIFIDAGNCVAHGEDLIKSVRAAGELLVHGHIKEPAVYGRGVSSPLPGYQGVSFGYEDHAELGSTGLIDWEAYVKALKEIRYKGFLSVESSSLDKLHHQDWDKAERSMKYVKKICEKVGI